MAVFFRQRRLLPISFMAIFVGILLYGLLTPAYQAHMKVLVRRGRVDPAVSPTPSREPFAQPQITEEELNSEVELFRDEDILRSVAQNSGLKREAGLGSKLAREDDEARLARAVARLGDRLEVDRIPKTTLISVSYASSDPAQAAKVLQNLASAYLERHRELRRPGGESQFFEQQMEEARGGLDNAELDLMNFTRGEGVVSASLQRDLTLQKLSEAETGQQQLRAAIAETTERVRALQAKLLAMPEMITTELRTSDNPQLQEKMKSRLLELQLKRTELLTKFQPSYRLVQEVDEQIAQTRAALAAEGLKPVQERTTAENPNHEWAKAELVKAQVELNAQQARAAAAEKLLASNRMAAEQLGNHAIIQEDLLRSLKAAEEKYLLYANKREEARIGDALDERGILNVIIAQPATVPALPARSGWTYGVVGFLAAGVVSTGLAFAADYLDPSFRTPEELSEYLGTPVLASLPHRQELGGR